MKLFLALLFTITGAQPAIACQFAPAKTGDIITLENESHSHRIIVTLERLLSGNVGNSLAFNSKLEIYNAQGKIEQTIESMSTFPRTLNTALTACHRALRTFPTPFDLFSLACVSLDSNQKPYAATGDVPGGIIFSLIELNTVKDIFYVIDYETH